MNKHSFICSIIFFVSFSLSSGNSSDTSYNIEIKLVNDEYTTYAKIYIENSKIQLASNKNDNLIEEISKSIKLPRSCELLFYYYNNSKYLIPMKVIAIDRAIYFNNSMISNLFINLNDAGNKTIVIKANDSGIKSIKEMTDRINWGRKFAIIINNRVRCIQIINDQDLEGNIVLCELNNNDEVDSIVKYLKK